MIGWGITFILVGIGSFFTTALGFQFVIVSMFNPHETLAAIGYTLLGIVLLALGLVRRANGAK
jgi:spore maturation protein SpmA